MFAAPTYLSSKLEESPVEDVTCLVYHMFTVYVIVCVSHILVDGQNLILRKIDKRQNIFVRSIPLGEISPKSERIFGIGPILVKLERSLKW